MSGRDDNTAVLDGPPSAPSSSQLIDARVVGRYELRGRLGEGGMGTVYRAWDPHLGREVALKLLKGPESPYADLDTSARARMLREARAMAQLGHPNVVEIFDVGIHGERIYIAMQLVEGGTLKEWMAQGGHGEGEVLDCFIAAAQGLAAAHAQGLVHRDFKPSNVLVDWQYDRVWVSDFGLARAGGESMDQSDSTDSPTVWSSAVTQAGEVVGTPAYMAPEQKRGERPDPRSDQYSLCVALYEALSGARPPRTAFAPPCSSNRRLAAAVERGLAPEPDGRWPGMDVLVAELERIRHPGRAAWVPAGLIGFSVAVLGWQSLPVQADWCADDPGLGGIWGQARRTEVSRSLSSAPVPYAAVASQAVEQKLDEVASRWVDAHSAACTAQTQPTTVLDCLDADRAELSRTVDLLAGGGTEIVERAVELARALPDPGRCRGLRPSRGGRESESDRRRRAELRASLAEGRALVRAGALERARQIEARLVPALADEADPLLEAEFSRFRGDLAFGEARYEESANLLAEAYYAAVDGGDEALALRLATDLVFTVGARLQRYDEGLSWSRHAQSRLSRAGTKRDEARLFSQLGAVLYRRGDYDAALRRLEQATTTYESIGGLQSPDLVSVLQTTGELLQTTGKYEEARAAFDRAMTIAAATDGESHPKVARLLNGVGNVLQRQAKFEEAQEVQTQAYQILEQAYGADHPDVAAVALNLGEIALKRGDLETAYDRYAQGHRAFEAAYGSEHPMVGSSLLKMGAARQLQEKNEEAIVLYQRALATWEPIFGPEHENIAVVLNNLGILLMQDGQFDEALDHHRRSAAIRRDKLGPEHPQVAKAVVNIAETYREMKRHVDAVASYREALTIFTTTLPDEHPNVAFTRQGLADSLLALGRFAQARTEAEAAVAARLEPNADPVERARARFLLAQSLWNTDERERARQEAKLALADLEGQDRPLANKRRSHIRGWQSAPY